MKRISVVSLALYLTLILALALGTACGGTPSTDVAAPIGALADNDSATAIDTDWSILTAESESPVLPSIADVVAAVKPSVVAIDTENLLALDIGDSSALRVGDWLVAIGNPLGLGISAKESIVSRLDVSLAVDGQITDGLIETSAAINPGNSGGPLVDMKGEVIGITSVKVASVEVESLGYAINIDGATPIIEALIETQYF